MAFFSFAVISPRINGHGPNTIFPFSPRPCAAGQDCLLILCKQTKNRRLPADSGASAVAKQDKLSARRRTSGKKTGVPTRHSFGRLLSAKLWIHRLR